MTSRKNTLLHYASMAACVLSAKTLAAQAVYTDLDPDVVVEMDPEILNIDMNGDGVLDFAFMNEIYTIFTFDSEPQSYRERIWAGPKNPDNAVAGSVRLYGSAESNYYYTYFPFALPNGFLINELLTFQNAGYQRMAFATSNGTHHLLEGGNWYPEINDHYLGVRFLDTLGCNHYGWIRCDVMEEGRVLVVKDYAYETKCDTPILAGDTIGDTTVIVDIETPIIDHFLIWSSGFTIHILTDKMDQPAYCAVVNSTGQLVHEGMIDQIHSEINLNHPSTGIYFVKLVDRNGIVIVRKIALK